MNFEIKNGNNFHISLNSSMMNEKHSQMVKHYLAFWMKYRETLLHGKMLYKGYASNYPYVSARSEQTQVGDALLL